MGVTILSRLLGLIIYVEPCLSLMSASNTWIKLTVAVNLGLPRDNQPKGGPEPLPCAERWNDYPVPSSWPWSGCHSIQPCSPVMAIQSLTCEKRRLNTLIQCKVCMMWALIDVALRSLGSIAYVIGTASPSHTAVTSSWPLSSLFDKWQTNSLLGWEFLQGWES